MKIAPTHSRRAFTLIELMVVIAIIAILAGLMTYLLPGVKEKQLRGRARAEMAMLTAAIKNYKVKKGFYPPTEDASRPTSLFYELTGNEFGTSYTNNVVRTNIFTAAEFFATFGQKGIVNSGEESQNFLSGIKASISKQIPGSSPPFFMLVFPYKGPGGGDFNPWRYDSKEPTHNPDSFDLWIDLVIGNKTVTIGNWND